MFFLPFVIENYDFFNQSKFVYKVLLKEDSLNIVEDDNFVKHHISLDYLDKLGYNKIIVSGHELEKLLYFLVCGNDALSKVYKGDTFMSDVIKKAKQIAGEEKLPLYLRDDKIKRLDRLYHHNEGKKEMIVNLFNNGVSLELISKSANLTMDEVKEIIKKNESK